jgi:hypothetical protein
MWWACRNFGFGTFQSCCDMLKKPWQLSTTGKKKTLYLAHVQIHQMISAPEEIDCDLCDILAKKGPCDMWLPNWTKSYLDMHVCTQHKNALRAQALISISIYILVHTYICIYVNVGSNINLNYVGLCNLSHDPGIYQVAPYLSIQACIWLTCLW